MEKDGGEGDEAEERVVCFFVANDQPSVFLNFSEEHCNAPSQAVDGFFLRDRVPTVHPSWDDRPVIANLR